MVGLPTTMKVLPFRIFDDQRVVPVQEEPLHIAAAGDSLLLIATCSGTVQAFSVSGTESILEFAFRVVNHTVSALLHIPIYDWQARKLIYLLT